MGNCGIIVKITFCTSRIKNRIKNTICPGLEILALIEFVFTDLWYPIWNVHLFQGVSCHHSISYSSR